MRVLLAGGGTAGHINPALAIAAAVKNRHPTSEILFVGNGSGMEAKLIPAAGYAFRGIDVRGFRRSLSPRSITYNIGAARRVITSTWQAGRIIRDFAPDIAVGTGGYVSGPTLRKAAQMGVPIVIHEQNAFPGVTTRMLAKQAACVMIAVEESRRFFDEKCRVELTGNPLRREVLTYSRASARSELELDERPLILSFGGSLGALKINRAVADLLAYSFKEGRLQHIHGVGAAGYAEFTEMMKAKGMPLGKTPHIRVREYIDDMPRCLAAADLVICRCGAITLSELQARGKAAILIPSPNVAENHQYHNAMAFVKKGGAVLIEDDKLTGDSLIRAVKSLTRDPERLVEMGRKAQKGAILDATERICTTIDTVLFETKKTAVSGSR